MVTDNLDLYANQLQEEVNLFFVILEGRAQNQEIEIYKQIVLDYTI